MKLPGIAVTALAISALVGGTAVAQVTMQPVPNPAGKTASMGGHHGHWRHHKGRHHKGRHWHHHHHHWHHHHHMKGAMKAAPAAAPAPASPQ
jgi:hypothetical protein